MRKQQLLFAAAWLLLLLSAQAPAQSLSAARAEIERLAAEAGAEVVAVAVYDFARGESLSLNEGVRMHAASTMKLPVMMELFRLAKEKRLSLDQPVAVRNRFASIVDGSPYQLNPADDSDDEVYRWIGKSMPLRELMRHMIVRSSNLATNLLVELARPESVNRLMRGLGAREMEVLRGVEDAKAFQASKNNTTTAHDLMVLLRAIAGDEFLDAASRREMIDILAAQEFNDGIPAGLPPGIRVAHKTGDITRHNHDAAIVFPPGRKPCVIVVLTKGIEDRRRSSRLIADIARNLSARLLR